MDKKHARRRGPDPLEVEVAVSTELELSPRQLAELEREYQRFSVGIARGLQGPLPPLRTTTKIKVKQPFSPFPIERLDEPLRPGGGLSDPDGPGPGPGGPRGPRGPLPDEG